jgi:hypothetical protein
VIPLKNSFTVYGAETKVVSSPSPFVESNPYAVILLNTRSGKLGENINICASHAAKVQIVLLFSNT